MTPTADTAADFAEDRKFRSSDMLVPLVLALGLVALSRVNFLWFHTLAELFSIVVGLSLYLIARDSFSLNRNGFLLFLAQGFFWAACIDLIHTLSYAGMGIYAEDDPNAATQLWVTGRLIEATTLLLAPRYLGHRQLEAWAVPLTGLIAALCTGLIFLGVFPDAYVSGQGLTTFKIAAEYGIILTLAVAGVGLHRRRHSLEPALYRILLGVIGLSIVSEFAFTLYVSVYAVANLIGHICKIWAFWLLLLVISRWMLAAPFRLLARNASSFDLVPVPVLMLSPDGIIQSCNAAARELRPNGGIGERHHAVWQPAELAEADCPICQARIAGRPVKAEIHDAQRDEWFVTRLEPIRQGDVLRGFVCVHTDIAERKRAEEALRHGEAALHRAQALAHIGSWAFDAQKNILTWSAESYRIFGIAAGTPLSYEAFLDCVHPDDRDRVTRAWQGALQGAPFDIEHRVIAQGEVKWVREQAELSVDAQGRLTAGIGTTQDITERKLAEERLLQAEKMDAIGKLTGGLAHDFNNLLGIILGSLDLLDSRLEGDDKARRHLDLAQRAARRATEVTRSLLAVARRQALAPRNIDVGEALADIMPLLRQSVGGDITVRENLRSAPDAAALHAYVDPAGLGNALLNLAINARDAMPTGGDLTIEAELQTIDVDQIAVLPDLTPGTYVVLRVSDNGSGMAKDVAAKAFEPFFSTKERGKGTGLGLAMVYGFARQSGGTATLYSHAGIGTTVHLYLPAVTNGLADHQRRDARPTDLPAGCGERVLVVDDEKELLGITEEWLAGLGYQVVAATSPQEALARLHDQDFQLLLTDVVMPGGINGISLAEKATALRPGLRVLLMSGFSDNLAHGDWPLLGKPYRRAELAQRLHQLLAAAPAAHNPKEN